MRAGRKAGVEEVWDDDCAGEVVEQGRVNVSILGR